MKTYGYSLWRMFEVISLKARRLWTAALLEVTILSWQLWLGDAMKGPAADAQEITGYQNQQVTDGGARKVAL